MSERGKAPKISSHVPARVVAVSVSPRHTFQKLNQLVVRLVPGEGVEGDAHAGRASGLMRATLARDAQGRLVRKAGVMSIVLAGGEVRPNDPIVIERRSRPHRALEPV